MSRSETENRTEQLKKAVLSGQMTADELKDRLRRMIDAELSKDDREIDADFVRACDDLLTELCGVPEPREDEFFEWQWAMIQRRIADRAERKRILIKASVIAAAAVLIVVLLGTVSIRLSWFHHYSTPDGQQYKIEGRQLTIDSGAIATEGDNVQNRLSSTDRNQIEEFLGFSLEGMIPDLEGWEIDNYFASFPSNYLIINIRYVNKKEKEKELGFIIHWLTDNADKDRFKQWSLDVSDIDKVTTINEEKEIRNINGQIVIRTAVASEEEVGLNYLWSDGLTFYELFGLSADEVIESFVRTNTTEEKAVIEGAIFKKLDSLQTPKPEPTATPTPPAVITTEITSEVLAETVARHGGYKGTVTEKREEAEAWLGFALDSVMPVIAGWENEFYQMTIFPAEIILFTVIKNTQNIQEVVRYTIHWVLDQDQFMAPLEQDQEGEYHWVNGQFVYRGTNYQDVFHVWSNGIAVYMLHGVASDELIDRFVRVESPKERETEPAPVATTSPSIELPAPDEFYELSDETIFEIIERHHDQLQSDNLEEIEAFLGFSLRNILPEVKGWEAYHYHVAVLYDNVFLLTDYRNQQDPNNKCRFKFQRFLNPETVYISVEQNEEGQYLRISGQQVYRSENYNSVSYTWTHGMTIYTLHGLTVDDIISQFVDPNNIEQNKPEPSPTPAVERTEVTAEMMASVVERRNCQPGELHSRLLADVESFLGFSMNGVLPDVEGWEAFDYHVDITADSVVVKTDYSDDNDYYIDNVLRFFSVQFRNEKNQKCLVKFQNALKLAITFYHASLQNMSYEGYQNAGIWFPSTEEGTSLLYCLLFMRNNSKEACRHGYEIGVLHELYSDTDPGYYAMSQLEKIKPFLGRYVSFDEAKTHIEYYILSQLALYIDSLRHKNILNQNIPNELQYRFRRLGDKGWSKLHQERKRADNDKVTLEDYIKLCNTYLGIDEEEIDDDNCSGITNN